MLQVGAQLALLQHLLKLAGGWLACDKRQALGERVKAATAWSAGRTQCDSPPCLVAISPTGAVRCVRPQALHLCPCQDLRQICCGPHPTVQDSESCATTDAVCPARMHSSTSAVVRLHLVLARGCRWTSQPHRPAALLSCLHLIMWRPVLFCRSASRRASKCPAAWASGPPSGCCPLMEPTWAAPAAAATACGQPAAKSTSCELWPGAGIVCLTLCCCECKPAAVGSKMAAGSGPVGTSHAQRHAARLLTSLPTGPMCPQGAGKRHEVAAGGCADASGSCMLGAGAVYFDRLTKPHLPCLPHPHIVTGHLPPSPTQQGTLHFAGEWPANAYTTAYYELPGGASFADNWHTYRLDWTKKQVGGWRVGASHMTRLHGCCCLFPGT